MASIVKEDNSTNIVGKRRSERMKGVLEQRGA